MTRSRILLLFVSITLSLSLHGKDEAPTKIRALEKSNPKAHEIALVLYDMMSDLNYGEDKGKQPRDAFPKFTEDYAIKIALRMEKGDDEKINALADLMRFVKAQGEKPRIKLEEKVLNTAFAIAFNDKFSEAYKVAHDEFYAALKTLDATDFKSWDYNRDTVRDQYKKVYEAVHKKLYPDFKYVKPDPNADPPSERKEDAKEHEGDGPKSKRPTAPPNDAWNAWQSNIKSEGDTTTKFADFERWLSAIQKHQPDDTSMNAAHRFLNASKSIKALEAILEDGEYHKYGLREVDRDFLRKILEVRKIEEIDALEDARQSKDKITAEAAEREILRRHNKKDNVRKWSQADFVRTSLNTLNKLEDTLSEGSDEAAAMAMVKIFTPLNETDLRFIRTRWERRSKELTPSRKDAADLDKRGLTYARRTHCGTLLVEAIRESSHQLNASQLGKVLEQSGCEQQKGFAEALNQAYAEQHKANYEFHQWLAEGNKDKIFENYDRADLEAYRNQRMATALNTGHDATTRGKAKAEWLALDKMLHADKYATVNGADGKKYTVRAWQNVDPGFYRKLNDDGTIDSAPESARKTAPIEIQLMGEEANRDQLFASAARFFRKGREEDKYFTHTGTRAYSEFSQRSRRQGFEAVKLKDIGLINYLGSLKEKHMSLYTPNDDTKDRVTFNTENKVVFPSTHKGFDSDIPGEKIPNIDLKATYGAQAKQKPKKRSLEEDIVWRIQNSPDRLPSPVVPQNDDLRIPKGRNGQPLHLLRYQSKQDVSFNAPVILARNSSEKIVFTDVSLEKDGSPKVFFPEAVIQQLIELYQVNQQKKDHPAVKNFMAWARKTGRI